MLVVRAPHSGPDVGTTCHEVGQMAGFGRVGVVLSVCTIRRDSWVPFEASKLTFGTGQELLPCTLPFEWYDEFDAPIIFDALAGYVVPWEQRAAEVTITFVDKPSVAITLPGARNVLAVIVEQSDSSLQSVVMSMDEPAFPLGTLRVLNMGERTLGANPDYDPEDDPPSREHNSFAGEHYTLAPGQWHDFPHPTPLGISRDSPPPTPAPATDNFAAVAHVITEEGGIATTSDGPIRMEQRRSGCSRGRQ